MKNVKEFLEEAKKGYPTQYDAEFLLAYMESLRNYTQGGLTPEYLKFYNKINSIHMKLWDKTFGSKSPWKPEGIGKKVKVVWDQSKANKLGIGDSQG